MASTDSEKCIRIDTVDGRHSVVYLQDRECERLLDALSLRPQAQATIILHPKQSLQSPPLAKTMVLDKIVAVTELP